MFSSAGECGGARLQPAQYTFSISIRSSGRRGRLSRPPTPPCECEERIHYPVFNPADPRHNSALRTSAWPDGTNNLAQIAHPVGPRRWMQTLPGRSLRRARSGLQALRSGFYRRPAHQNIDGDNAINGAWPSSSDSAEGSSDRHDNRFSSTVSEASTEEDYDFGTNLYRTDCNHRDSGEGMARYAGPSSHIPRPHPGLTPASSAGADTPPVHLIEATTPACSREDLSAAVADLDHANHDDGARANADNQRMGENITSTVPPSTAAKENPNPPVQSPPNSSATPANAQNPAGALVEADTSPSAAEIRIISEPQVVVEETNTTPISGSPSSGRSQLRQIDQAPYEGIKVAEEVEETPATGILTLECFQTENTREDAESTPGVGKVPENLLDNVVPEVALGDFGDMSHILSLNPLDGGVLTESTGNDEVSGPTSQIEDEANTLLNPWLPLDKGDRSSLLSMRDEFFLVDGKSTDLRPDRGDNPLKGERAFTGDGGLYSGPGLDRDLSIRTQEVPEIIGPGGPTGLTNPRPLRRDRDGSDSTEEYLVTYSLLHRHYFS
ncbi:uncharacterized protein BJX67DRAFT_11441 [Aspergillus lucknowensis]|uniref:Uncharacterized protein n=1 Tax=Aspergillus lucknowensis TaxID=176173 RepID=A0ABR4M7C9_9EURO